MPILLKLNVSKVLPSAPVAEKSAKDIWQSSRRRRTSRMKMMCFPAAMAILNSGALALACEGIPA